MGLPDVARFFCEGFECSFALLPGLHGDVGVLDGRGSIYFTIVRRSPGERASGAAVIISSPVDAERPAHRKSRSSRRPDASPPRDPPWPPRHPRPSRLLPADRGSVAARSTAWVSSSDPRRSTGLVSQHGGASARYMASYRPAFVPRTPPDAPPPSDRSRLRSQ